MKVTIAAACQLRCQLAVQSDGGFLGRVPPKRDTGKGAPSPPTPVGDTSYRSPSPAMSLKPLSPRLPHDGEPSALSLTVVTAAVPGSADSRADTDSMLGGGIDADVDAQWHITAAQPKAAALPISRASSEAS